MNFSQMNKPQRPYYLTANIDFYIWLIDCQAVFKDRNSRRYSVPRKTEMHLSFNALVFGFIYFTPVSAR